MGLKTKETDGGEQPPKPDSQGPKTDAAGERRPRVNPEVEKRLNPYIAANPDDFARYTKLVREDPARAVRSLMLKDMERHARAMRLVERQLPAARDWYGRQTPEMKKGIDEVIAKVDPFYKDQAFVTAVVRERTWQNRLPLTPTARPAMRVA